MTEKRFGIIKTKTYGLYVPVDKMEVYNFSGFESEFDCIRVVNALNNLEEKRRENGKIACKYLEENEQLKHEVNYLQDRLDDYVLVEKENKELQGKYDKQLWLYNGLGCEYDWLKERNEQSKSIVKEVIELLSEEVDVFSDKATEHDINAYIELKELDNKDAYYMATATKKAIKLLKGVVDD